MDGCLWLIASIAAGEAPVALMGEEAFAAVVWTMRNRMHEWGLPCMELPKAYYGRGSPTPREAELTQAVWRARDDPTGGGKWALSKEDRLRWGLRRGDLVYRSGAYEIHIYRGDPWRARGRQAGRGG